MRLPVPTRLKFQYVAIFAIAMFLAQQVNGTDLLFSVLTAIYIVFFALAFNVAGGVVYPSGAWIFFNGTLSAVIGLSYKNLIGEPGQSNLISPNVTMGVYCAGMATIAVAAYATRRLRPKQPILKPMLVDDGMRRLALGCMILGIVFSLFGVLLPFGLYTALSQLNRFGAAAIVVGVFYEIRASGGRRSVNWIVWLAGANTFSAGILGFTKEGMLIPFLAWILPCTFLGYKFSKAQVVGIVLGAALFVTYLTPYAQLARRDADEVTSFSSNVEVASRYLSDLSATRKEYEETLRDDEGEEGYNLFDKPQGLFDRLQMIGIDDALITATDRTREIGIGPTYISYINLIPHFLYPNKPTASFGNLYARELGIIPQSDTTTGISFSPTADAYHQLKWYGVLLLLPAVVFLLFFPSDSLTGDVRTAPWGMLLIVLFAHAAPEELIEGNVHASLFAPLTVIMIWLLARYIMPAATMLFLGHRSSIRMTRGLSSAGVPGPARAAAAKPRAR